MSALPLLIAWPVTNAYTVSEPVLFWMLNETVAAVSEADSRMVSRPAVTLAERRSPGTVRPSSGAATAAADPASMVRRETGMASRAFLVAGFPACHASDGARRDPEC